MKKYITITRKGRKKDIMIIRKRKKKDIMITRQSLLMTLMIFTKIIKTSQMAQQVILGASFILIENSNKAKMKISGCSSDIHGSVGFVIDNSA